jgi:hypothetical protein
MHYILRAYDSPIDMETFTVALAKLNPVAGLGLDSVGLHVDRENTDHSAVESDGEQPPIKHLRMATSRPDWRYFRPV